MEIDVTNLGTLTPIHTNFGSNKDDLLIVEYDVPQRNVKQTLFFKYGQLSIPKWALIPAGILAFGLITALCAIIVNSILSQAVATVTYSQECGKLSKCKEGVGLICGSAGRCVCLNTQYWYENKCDQQPTYGEKCNQTIECRTDLNLICAEFDGLCNCPNTSKVQTCDCPSTYYWTGSSCTTRSSVLGSCSVANTSYQCLSNLYCNGTKCICEENTYYWNGTASECFPIDKYMAACDVATAYSCDTSVGLSCVAAGQGSQCPFNATASWSCDCANLTYWNGGSCVSKKLVDTSCFWNCECDSDRGLSCLNMTCLCPKYYYWSTVENPPACVLQKNYSETQCFNTTQCDSTQGLTCYLSGTACNCPTTSVINMCDCLPTQYYDYSRLSCQNLLLYNDSCTANYMCNSNVGLFCQTSVNNANNCSCPETSRANMCDCNASSYWNGIKCTPRLAPNVSCTYDYECQSGYICLVNQTDNGYFSDVCRCPIGQYYVNGSGCVPSLNYSDICIGSYQCYELATLSCRYNFTNLTCLISGDLPACDCADNYYYNSSVLRCLPRLNQFETCQFTCECNPPFICTLNATCDCEYYYSSINQTCVRYLQYGDSCQNTAQCADTPNAYMTCDNTNTCTCNSSGYWNGSQCVFTSNFRISCNKNKDCYGELMCRNIPGLSLGQTCSCPDKTYFSPTYQNCTSCTGSENSYERYVINFSDRDACVAIFDPSRTSTVTYSGANTGCAGLTPYGSTKIPILISLHNATDLLSIGQVLDQADNNDKCPNRLYYLGLNSSTSIFFDGTAYFSVFTSPVVSSSQCLTACLLSGKRSQLGASACGTSPGTSFGAICDYRVD
ncbi:unnamed protein product [Adineta ricciae]|uniref:EGF-like domain-containing protein n=1 Tax=Adineta ricciae TaxID=249248 RepID=A0A815WLR3_ADIRI|nr:unnamed protein product [Adineta ricciae]